MNESAIGNYIHRSLQGYRRGDESPHLSEATKAYAAKKSQIQ